MKGISRFLALLLALFLALPATASEKVTVMLDWFPNMDHLPLFVARDGGHFAEVGLDVELLAPSDTATALKLALAAKVDLAVTYESQALLAASEGHRPAVTSTLIDSPLNVVLFLKGKGIERPEDLAGRTVGYTEPDFERLLKAALTDRGVDDVETVHVHFSIVPSLITGKADAVIGAYRNYEVTTLEREGYEGAFFTLEELGFPPFSELVIVASPKWVQSGPDRVSRFNAALEKAVAAIDADFQGALDLFFKALPEADRDFEEAVFARTVAFFPRRQHLDEARWQAFADHLHDKGVLARSVDVADLLVQP